MPSRLPAFTRDAIEHFLAEHGYTSNPDRLISPFPVDYISETNGVAYLDVNADAVRKGGCGSRPAGSRKFLHSV
jgi:hypothetical protein